MQRSITMKTFLPYPAEKVWSALTDPQILGQWFMKNNIHPEPGYEFNFQMAPQKGWDGITHED